MAIRIGTRGSALALWQANHVKARLEPVLGPIELEIIKTTGDRNQTDPLSKVGGKGLFVKEIEEALLEKRVSIAVHSAKDLPSVLPEGLVIAAFPEREDPRDALLVRHGGKATLASLPTGARVGTSSLRRMAQLKAAREDLVTADLRGNVDTRIRKLDAGEFDAIVLAVAGLVRLGFGDRIGGHLGPPEMIPAVGQGALGIEMRGDDPLLAKVAGALDHPATRSAVEAERAFLATLEGGCTVPVAAHASLSGERLELEGLIASPFDEPVPGSSARAIRASRSGDPADAVELGRGLAETLLRHGGREILDAVRAAAAAPPDHP